MIEEIAEDLNEGIIILVVMAQVVCLLNIRLMVHRLVVVVVLHMECMEEDMHLDAVAVLGCPAIHQPIDAETMITRSYWWVMKKCEILKPDAYPTAHS
ncbi:hypothetical protein F2Q68_00000510 [Brassica cretica]|uniref:Uncharacterized protein n=1 Tax=Brassica cretica TaxID=69181 RepID=A0A8S9JF01_BRACR|nr:hypothetical protein F2Q68_00000510 [Brassica cretica]